MGIDPPTAYLIGVLYASISCAILNVPFMLLVLHLGREAGRRDAERKP